MLRELQIFFLLSLTLNCVSSQNKKNSDKIIAELDKKAIEPTNTAIATGIYKDLLKSPENHPIAKNFIDLALNAIKEPARSVIETFASDDTIFACKEAEGGKALLCEATMKGETKPYMKAHLGGQKHAITDFFEGFLGPVSYGTAYVLHFCNISPGTITIAKDNDDFWENITKLGDEKYNHKTGKEALDKFYAKHQNQKVNLNGVRILMKTEKGAKKPRVVDFRASIGDVTNHSSEEYKEFVADTCTEYMAPKTDL